MGRLTAVDANVLLRWLVGDDEALTERVGSILDDALPKSLVLDRLTLAEIAYVLKSRYHYPKGQIVRNLQILLRAEQFSIPDRELVALAVDLFLSEAPLSFEDCWLLALKRSGKVSGVHTFDQALKKRF